MPSSVGCITNTFESDFSVHTSSPWTFITRRHGEPGGAPSWRCPELAFNWRRLVAPGSKVSSTIRTFSDAVQRRRTDVMISMRSVGLVIETVVCLTLTKWETVSGRFGGYLSGITVRVARHCDEG